ncbi:MAG: glycerate kinase [Acidiferrobacteraceae bacterium]
MPRQSLPQPPVVVVAPNAFKGTLSAREAAEAMAAGVRAAWSACTVRLCPMADGGDGTLDLLLRVHEGREHGARARDALGQLHTVRYGVLDAGEAPEAVIEVAEIVGLHRAKGPVSRRTTLGVGDVARHALDHGLRRFVIGLGGTGTNEGGAGFLAALGARFLGPLGEVLHPSPEGLWHAQAVDLRALDPRLYDCSITALADVLSPLCGPEGATCLYGPQKGVADHELGPYDALLARIGGWYGRQTGRDCVEVPGSGAAGGLGAALLALGAALEPGARVLAEHAGLRAMLAGAALLLTGEGRTDRQSLQGKVPWVVGGMALDAGVPGVLVSGRIAHDVRAALSPRFVAACELVQCPEDLPRTRDEASRLLATRTREAVSRWLC